MKSTTQQRGPTSPKIEVSIGELFDRICRIEALLERPTNAVTHLSLRRELAQLLEASPITVFDSGFSSLLKDLKQLNSDLLELKEKACLQEKQELFDSRFIEVS